MRKATLEEKSRNHLLACFSVITLSDKEEDTPGSFASKTPVFYSQADIARRIANTIHHRPG